MYYVLLQEGGKPTTKTREFQRPVTQEELETIWDEQTLRLLVSYLELTL